MATKIPPVTEQEWLECNEWNRMVIEEFLDQQHLSDHTVKQYASGAKIFARWVKEKAMNKPIYKLRSKDALNYQNYLMKLGLSSSAVKFKRSTVSTLCNYIEVYYSEDDEECKNFRNIFNKAIPSPPKETVRTKNIIEKKDFERLIKTLEKNKEYQMVAYLLLSYSSGARRSEIAQMKKEFFDMPKVKGKDFYRTPEVRGKGRGKVGKKIKLMYDERARKAVKKWLDVRGEDDCDAVFVYKTKSKTEALKPDAFNGWFKKKFNVILGDDTLAPHSLRRTRASHIVVEEGKDINVVKSLLNHNSTETSQIYVMKDDSDDVDDAF